MNIPEEDLSYTVYEADVYHEFEDPENYIFEEKGDFILVKNNNLGFSFEIPNDWSYEKYHGDEDDISKGLDVFSSDYIPESETSFIPKEGCIIGISSYEYYSIKDNIEDFNWTKERKESIEEYYKEWPNAEKIGTTIDDIIKKSDPENETGSRDIVKIDNYYALSHGIGMNQRGLIAITEIPTNKITYEVQLRFTENKRKECGEVYYNLLKSVSLSKNED